MSILLVISTPGGSKEENTIALIPADKLDEYDLDLIDGFMVNADDIDPNNKEASDNATGQIINLYKRLGIERQSGWENDVETNGKVAVPILPTDLAEYLNPQTPMLVHRVVKIGWAV